MNFNLISPDANGYDYQTRFRDDIVIDPNSSVYCNFVELAKRNSIIITEDQTITVTSEEMLPILLPVVAPTPDDVNEFELTAIIPKGTYTPRAFQTALSTALNTAKGANPRLAFYNAIDKFYQPQFDQRVLFGYFLSDTNANWKTTDMVLDGVDGLDFGSDPDDNSLVRVAATNAATNTYDAYGLADKHYWHYFYGCPEQPNNNNLVIARTNINMADLQIDKVDPAPPGTPGGAIGIGLYSKEYITYAATAGNIISGANWYVANGTSQATSSGAADPKMPRCFVWIDIYDKNGVKYFRVSWARNTAQGRINNWTLPNNVVNRTQTSFVKALTDFFPNLNQPLSIAFQTYYDISSDDFQNVNRRLYLRIYKWYGQDKLVDSDLIYDSKGTDWIPYKFFSWDDDPTFINTAARANGAIPFNVMISATRKGHGWHTVNFRTIDKTGQDVNNPFSVVQKYNVSFTSELAEYLNTANTGSLFPNICELMVNAPSFYYVTDMALNFLNDSYSVYIEELPIKSFKNTETQANGGYSQNILINCPTPFQLATNVSKDDALMTVVYQPNFKIIHDMKNQGFKTNHFRVKIFNMRTGKPALELKRATVNFTINGMSMRAIEM